MKKALKKDFWMEIRKSPARFISIFFIVALGVAFFSGIQASSPDMRASGDAYFDANHLMDIKVVSTLGFEEKDIQALAGVDGVELAEGAYGTDVLCGEENSQSVLHIESINDQVNELTVSEGRLPEEKGECFLDTAFFESKEFSLGDTLQVQEEGENGILTTKEFEIVGHGSSPLYISFSRGNTTLGTGEVDGFIYVPAEAFSQDTYTQAYLLVDQAADLSSYSDGYSNLIEKIRDRLEGIEEEQCRIRYADVKEEAEEELADAEKELADGKKEAEEELADARKELADGRKEYEDGLAEYEDGKKQLEDAKKEIADGKKELEDGKKQLEDGKEQIRDAKKQVADGYKELADSRAKLTDGRQELEDGKRQLEEGQQQLDQQKEEAGLEEAQKELEAGKEQLAAGWKAYEEGVSQIQQYEENLPQVKEGYAQASALLAQAQEGYAQAQTAYEALGAAIEAGIATEEMKAEYEKLGAQIAELEGNIAVIQENMATLQAILDREEEIALAKAALPGQKEQLEASQAQLEAGEAELSEGLKQIEAAQAQLDAARAEIEANEAVIVQGEAQIKEGEAQLESAQAEIEANEQTIKDSEKEIAENETKIEDGEKEIAENEEKLADARKELEDAQKKLEDGEKEYEDGKKEAEEEIAEGEQKLADAREELQDLEVPQWYITDREDLPEYSEYGENADRIQNIGKVFPVIFFLVAALISLTTMTRMVEEQRTQIGTLKALGYEKGEIAAKYLRYAFLATVGGSILGVLFGEKVLPFIIIKAYGIMYHSMDTQLRIQYEWKFALIASGAAIACTMGATFVSCRRELAETPANLMRPPAPKEGKRVWLEKVPFIWKHLNFTWKSTVRNLFRYKKRFFMTIFGISGSMALMLVGFGLRDSIMDIANIQYEELQHFDGTVILDEDATDQEKEELTEYLDGQEEIKRATQVLMKTMTADTGKSKLSEYIYVPGDMESFEKDVTLRDRKTQEEFQLDDTGAVISEKTASLLDVKAGETIVLEEDNREYEVPVAAVCENYMGHYVYMTEAVYREIFEEDPEYNDILITYKAEEESRMEEIGQEILEKPAALSISYTGSIKEQLNRMLSSLGMVIVVLIVSAGMLAFVVLYNLNNINITERQRELATLKVLGFYDKEVAGYVFRENVLLTLIGVLTGALLGIGLHRYVITTVEVEACMFGRNIGILSYLISGVLTCAFALIVNQVMHHKLKKINMVESLKSVE